MVGVAYGIKCDHEDDFQTKIVIDKIISEQGKIDILVNNVWDGYEYYNNGTEFWNETGFWTTPISRFDKMFNSGVRAHYVTSYGFKYKTKKRNKTTSGTDCNWLWVVGGKQPLPLNVSNCK